MKPAQNTSLKANPLIRSVTEPSFRAKVIGPPSKLVEALDVTEHKRSKSCTNLVPQPPPRVVAPRPPQPGRAYGDAVVQVRTVYNNESFRSRALRHRDQALRSPEGDYRDPRLLRLPLLRVLVDEDTLTRYLISPPVRAGSHGEFHIVRRERPGRPSDLWGAKQFCLTDSDPSLPQYRGSIVGRDVSFVAEELTGMLAAGSPLVPTVFLQTDDRFFAMGPMCDGNLYDIKPNIAAMGDRAAELFLLDITLQVAKRLQHCHAAGLTHRDIKPENIFYKQNGQVYLADFSMVTSAPKNDGADNEAAPSVLGTLGFIAPEYAKRGELTPQVDLFSLGCTLIDLIAHSPFLQEFRPLSSHAQFMIDIGMGTPPKVQDPWQFMTRQLDRFKAWERAFRDWQKNPDAGFKCDHDDFTDLFGPVMDRFPTFFPVLMDMLAYDPKKRIDVTELIAHLESLPHNPADREIRRQTWAHIPREPELDGIFRRWCEPHLPTLRRTTSADNLPKLMESMTFDNAMLASTDSLG